MSPAPGTASTTTGRLGLSPASACSTAGKRRKSSSSTLAEGRPAAGRAHREALEVAVVDRARLAGQVGGGGGDVGRGVPPSSTSRVSFSSIAVLWRSSSFWRATVLQVRPQLGGALCLLDGDAGQVRERRGHGLVLLRERVRLRLVVEVEDAHDVLAHDHRDAEDRADAPRLHDRAHGARVVGRIAHEHGRLGREDLLREPVGHRSARSAGGCARRRLVRRLDHLAAIKPGVGVLEVDAAAAALDQHADLAGDEMQDLVERGLASRSPR